MMKKGIILSVLFHLVLVALLLVGVFQYVSAPESANPELEVIEAYSVDASSLDKEIPKSDTKSAPRPDPAKQQLEQQRRLELEKKIKEEIALKQKRLARERKLKEIEKKRQVEKKQKELAEKKRQEKLKRQKAAKAEVKRKAKLAEEQKRAAARRKAELAAAAAEKAKTNSIINKYISLIKRKMERNWQRPVDTRPLVCTAKIKLLPDGSVLDVRVVKSSGSSGFDGSVIDALYRAGTFPLPKEPKYRKLFLEDEITMKFTNS